MSRSLAEVCSVETPSRARNSPVQPRRCSHPANIHPTLHPEVESGISSSRNGAGSKSELAQGCPVDKHRSLAVHLLLPRARPQELEALPWKTDPIGRSRTFQVT